MEPIKTVPGDVARQKFASMVDLVRQQAAARPEHPALIFLSDGEVEADRLTYIELDRRARAFAAHLQERGLAGHPILLTLPSGADYVVAFLGSLYAGSIPVPVYPPTNSLHSERLAQIIKDCDARALVIPAASRVDDIRAKLERLFPEGMTCAFLSADEMSQGQEERWTAPALDAGQLAYLQYTSGSTSQPRGVMVSHRNLLEYCASWQEGTGVSGDDVFVTWLPLFHDMGLILGVIEALYAGATIVMMSPVSFIQKPLRWLAAISK